MANTGVSGRVIYTGTTNGIPHLKVEVVDLDAVPTEQRLGWATTDTNGRYSLTYAASTYGGVEGEPDIVVRIYDQFLRLLHETAEITDVTATTLVIPDIALHPNNVNGWLVTNATINPSGNPVNLSVGNEIHFLIDNELAWSEITDAAANARVLIHFQNLNWDLPDTITKFTSPLVEGTRVTGEQLHTKFTDKSSENIPVRVIVNDFFLYIPIPIISPIISDIAIDIPLLDTASGVKEYFRDSNVQVRVFETALTSPFHAKLMVVDDTAYLIGSPITQEYYDTQAHSIDEKRRGPKIMFITSRMGIKLPLHEVSVKILGPAVTKINETFCMAWNKINPTSDPISPALEHPEQNGLNTASVQVIRSLPTGAFEQAPHGETGILEAYQRAIANAENYIYIEDQYFTNYDLVNTLIRSLEIHPSLQLILVLNTKVDIPGYPSLQPRVVNHLLNGLKRVGAENRVGIFTLWSHEIRVDEAGTGTRIIPNYVHSKVSIVDDKWATVGSANTDGTSLNQTQIFGGDRTRGVFSGIRRRSQHATLHSQGLHHDRAVELNLVIYNNIGDQPSSMIVGDLRRRLWQEHLGFTASTDSALNIRPSHGWLSLWNERAQNKLEGLLESPINIRTPRILKWTVIEERHSDPNNYLRALGVDILQTHVIKEFKAFDFSTGNWQ